MSEVKEGGAAAGGGRRMDVWPVSSTWRQRCPSDAAAWCKCKQTQSGPSAQHHLTPDGAARSGREGRSALAAGSRVKGPVTRGGPSGVSRGPGE